MGIITEQWAELMKCVPDNADEAEISSFRDLFLAGAISALYSIWPKAVAAATADEIREALLNARLECSRLRDSPATTRTLKANG